MEEWKGGVIYLASFPNVQLFAPSLHSECIQLYSSFPNLLGLFFVFDIPSIDGLSIPWMMGFSRRAHPYSTLFHVPELPTEWGPTAWNNANIINDSSYVSYILSHILQPHEGRFWERNNLWDGGAQFMGCCCSEEKSDKGGLIFSKWMCGQFRNVIYNERDFL